MESLSSRFAALGHPQRLAVWCHLVSCGPQPVAAGEVARALGIKPSTLSMYLRRLTEAGLAGQQVQGPLRLYHARCDGLIGDLAALDLPAGGGALRDLPVRVGFVCRDGGARSRFAAALLNRVGAPRFVAASGGLHPPRRDPLADQVLDAAGHELHRLAPALQPDVVIRLTRAPMPEAPPDGPVLAHWRVPDPAVGEAGVVAGLGRLGRLYRNLAAQVAALAALPVERMPNDALARALVEIGTPARPGARRTER